jgi:hypothetical protein
MKIQARMQQERGWLRRLWTRGRAALDSDKASDET